MNCPKCSTENAGGAQFCRHCGEKLREGGASKVPLIVVLSVVACAAVIVAVVLLRPPPRPDTLPRQSARIWPLRAEASSHAKPSSPGRSASGGGPFPPSYVLDDDPNTCWTPEPQGPDVVGQWIRVLLPNKARICSIGVRVGYEKFKEDKNLDRFPINYRLKRATFELSEGSPASFSRSLGDRKGVQVIAVNPPRSTSWVKMTVDDYYDSESNPNGKRYYDICIPEILIWGYEE